MNLPDRIARIVREWPDWSPAERRRMDDVTEDILHHCRTGEGNAFVRGWCERVLRPALDRTCPQCGDYSPENAHTDKSVAGYSCERCETTWGAPS
jgi:ribosomal protein S27AE